MNSSKQKTAKTTIIATLCAVLFFVLAGFYPDAIRLDATTNLVPPPEAATAASKRTSVQTISGHTEPVVIQTGRANAWSTIAYFDLTDEKDIPDHAVVTKITLTGDSSGGFATPRRAIVDEEGERVYVNSFSNETKAHNGKRVRQRWAVQFITSSIWDGPAMLRPIVNIHYEY